MCIIIWGALVLNPNIDYLRDKANRLSLSPGVYLMKDKTGKIIYVGKAKALKNRVTSYFRHDSNHNAKTLKLIDNIADFDFIVCPSELDALVLECSLIKLHKPKYNILLKDDKGYNYIKISKGAYPRISYALNTNDPNADYLGPFTSGFTVKQAVEEVNTIFPLPAPPYTILIAASSLSACNTTMPVSSHGLRSMRVSMTSDCGVIG